MLVACLAPDVLLIDAVSGHFNARQLLRNLKSAGGEKWALSHAHLARADGFRLRASTDAEDSACSDDHLVKMVQEGLNIKPPLSEEELWGRSKSDWLIKAVAVSQIAWFGIQILSRAVQHLAVSVLEILTLAFVVCSMFTYGLLWHRPQNVEYPVILHTPHPVTIEDQRIRGSGINESNMMTSEYIGMRRQEDFSLDSLGQYAAPRI
ncbi:hypothetical protein MMC21_007875 [Puttea exsequens]|nr:hypothetical protein [Puttea exsequens]